MSTMYSMKNIITHDGDIPLPKCMYHMKNIYNFETTASPEEEIGINVRKQVIKFLKMPSKEMADLEIRQDQLLKKLDILYDRIKTISSFCKVSPIQESRNSSKNAALIEIPEELVLVYTPDCLPWFLKKVLKESNQPVNVSWHIHSSVPSEKVPKIQAFVKGIQQNGIHSKVNIRLIFKCVSADPEMKLSSLDIPIVGNVNILRYLSLAYPSILPYDSEDYIMDNLLDICHQLERTAEKDKEALTKKLFIQSMNWIYNNEFTIVDAAAYNILKQWQNNAKYATKDWLMKCDKLF